MVMNEQIATLPSLAVSFCGITLKNPVVTVSGTCGFGQEYADFYSPSALGAITVKGLTLKPRLGNPTPRIAETPAGILNSIGLQNPGVEHFLREELPRLKKQNAVVIANIAGSTIEDYCQMAETLSDSPVDFIEMNISCPNVKEGGVAFGTRPETVEKITSQVRKYTKKPLIVKLSPNVTDITETARAAAAAGADALSLINTLTGMRIDVRSRKPILANIIGGLSGPAVFPVALRMVWQVRRAVSLPIIGMGGISDADTAVEMLLAGADIIGVGTASFSNPSAPMEIISGIADYLRKNRISSVRELSQALL